MTPADFARLKATLDANRMRGAVAAGIRVVVTHVALLTLLHDLVPTDGLVTYWKQEAPYTIGLTTTKYTRMHVHYPSEAIVLGMIDSVSPSKHSSFFSWRMLLMCLTLHGENLSLFSRVPSVACGNIR